MSTKTITSINVLLLLSGLVIWAFTGSQGFIFLAAALNATQIHKFRKEQHTALMIGDLLLTAIFLLYAIDGFTSFDIGQSPVVLTIAVILNVTAILLWIYGYRQYRKKPSRGL